MIEKKKLSLCMITNNDEKYLFDFLQDLKAVVDEVIIVDIGSIDKTVEIAKQAGANVYQMEWRNSYSEAKNFCLNHANGRWILFLQANETISEEHLKEIKPLLDNPNAEGYFLYVDCNLNGHGISSPTQSLRLFRNRKEYRYQYKSFELISDELITNIKDTCIKIVHRDDSVLPWEISSRILLLQEDIIEHPEDSYVQYIYGIELLNQQKYEESIMHFQKARADVNFGYLFAPHLYKCLAWSLLYLQRYTEALDVLDEGVSNFSFYTDLLVLRGELYKQLKQYDKAIQDLNNCLKIKEQLNFMVPGPEIDNSVVLESLGEVHEEIFNNWQALACYQKAYELNNTNYDLLTKIDELTKKTDSTEVIENLLKTSIEQKHNGYVETAREQMKLGDTQPLEEIECILWSEEFIVKLEEWIGQVKGIATNPDAAVTLASRIPDKPSKALMNFYHSLNITKSNNDKSTPEDGGAELTCTEVHVEIGAFYEKVQKNNEAMSAYLRALQWDPQNERAKEKIIKFANKSPSWFQDILEEKEWVYEGSWFHHKQEFVNYIHGLVSFKNQQFEQAFTFFSQIAHDETSYPIVLAYIISGLWLEEKKAEAENLIVEYGNSIEILLYLFNICKSYVLYKLNEGHQKYPYSELIQKEEERIRNRNLIWTV